MGQTSSVLPTYPICQLIFPGKIELRVNNDSGSTCQLVSMGPSEIYRCSDEYVDALTTCWIKVWIGMRSSGLEFRTYANYYYYYYWDVCSTGTKSAEAFHDPPSGSLGFDQ
jgi:hypothetical protein